MSDKPPVHSRQIIQEGYSTLSPMACWRSELTTGKSVWLLCTSQHDTFQCM